MIDDRLVADLDSFFAKHRRCSELDTGTTKTEPCACGSPARVGRGLNGKLDRDTLGLPVVAF